MSDVLPNKRRTRESTVSVDNGKTKSKRNRKQAITGQNYLFKRHSNNKPDAPSVQPSPTNESTDTDDLEIYELENYFGKQIMLNSAKDKHLKVSFKDGQPARCSSDPQLSETCSKEEEEQYTDSGIKCSNSSESSCSNSDDISISSSATYESKENSPFESQTKNSDNSIDISPSLNSGSNLEEGKPPVGKSYSAQESIKYHQTRRRWSHMLLTHNTRPIAPLKEYQRSISNCVE